MCMQAFLFVYNEFSNVLWMSNIIISSQNSVNQIDDQQRLAQVIYKRDGIKEISIAAACIDPQVPKNRGQDG